MVPTSTPLNVWGHVIKFTLAEFAKFCVEEKVPGLKLISSVDDVCKNTAYLVTKSFPLTSFNSLVQVCSWLNYIYVNISN